MALAARFPAFFVFPFLLVSATFFEICYPGSRIVGMPRGQLPGWPVGYSTLTGILISLRELRKAAPRRSDGNPAVSDHRELRAAQENETARRIRRGFAQQRRYAACLRRHPDHSAKPEASPMLLQLSDDLDQVSASRGSLLERMQRYDLSRWHPDPLAAIEEASCRAHDRFR
jgi:hypothetical protein